MISGREMGLTSHQVKKKYMELKKTKEDNIYKLCDNSGCRGGFRVDNTNGELVQCNKCKGYGFFKK